MNTLLQIECPPPHHFSRCTPATHLIFVLCFKKITLLTLCFAPWYNGVHQMSERQGDKIFEVRNIFYADAKM